MNIDIRPEWLKKYASGLQSGYRYKEFLETEHFAIFRAPGHMSYLNRMDGCKYYPTHYTLIEKGTCFWDHKSKDVWKGRMNKHIKQSLIVLISQYEAGEIKFK